MSQIPGDNAFPASNSLPGPIPGRWLDCSDLGRTRVGCHVCGWVGVGPYAEARGDFLIHTHDPLFDIRTRLDEAHDQIWGEIPLDVYRADVAYLLALIPFTDPPAGG